MDGLCCADLQRHIVLAGAVIDRIADELRGAANLDTFLCLAVVSDNERYDHPDVTGLYCTVTVIT